jgi:hypothetical protein
MVRRDPENERVRTLQDDAQMAAVGEAVSVSERGCTSHNLLTSSAIDLTCASGTTLMVSRQQLLHVYILAWYCYREGSYVTVQCPQ